MLRSYKYRLYPTKFQCELIDKHISCTRLIYNLGLEVKSLTYSSTGISLNKDDLSKQLTELKKEYCWLNEINSQSLQYSLRKLDNAFTNFFNKQSKYPTFKNKRKSRWTCHFPQRNKIDYENKLLKLSKFSEGIKIIIDRIPYGKIKSVCISKTPTGKYFASINVETGEDLPKKKIIKKEIAIGIDLGLKDYAVLSNGNKIKNPKWIKQSEIKLKILQKRLSKKEKGSNRRNLAKLKIARQHEKITNQRNDFLHKLSNEITNHYDTICLEDLNINGMMKNHSLAGAIGDVGWGRFVEFLKYKSEWKGKNILQIGRFEPSSKMCGCGVINKELKLKDREWKCSNCRIVNDRDELAANNIKKFAFLNLERINKSGRGSAVEDVELSTLVGTMKRQIHKR